MKYNKESQSIDLSDESRISRIIVHRFMLGGVKRYAIERLRAQRLGIEGQLREHQLFGVDDEAVASFTDREADTPLTASKTNVTAKQIGLVLFGSEPLAKLAIPTDRTAIERYGRRSRAEFMYDVAIRFRDVCVEEGLIDPAVYESEPRFRLPEDDANA